MTISTIRGIVIKETFSGDSDKYIIIFAKDIGKVSVFAKGARKLKSKFLAGTALFTYGDFIVKESREFLWIKEWYFYISLWDLFFRNNR